ncbi:hypothetical protein EV421DRAFT_1839943 [Armillaria borealis]|uniref:Uncharacterized protein n=1 Tax=Armillaria borealis TaxID=47425 RepID=A0AA39J1N2_9AGAR|nr:hypothetical protein EV421DRAFT_1839943 [Armillaria borealis]
MLHGVSAFGTRLSFYSYDKQTRIFPKRISPGRERETDSAPSVRCVHIVLETASFFDDFPVVRRPAQVQLMLRHHCSKMRLASFDSGLKVISEYTVKGSWKMSE